MSDEQKAKLAEGRERARLEKAAAALEQPGVIQTPGVAPVEQEATVKMSDVAKMIADAIANSKEADKPQKAKRVTEHYAHVWRFDGKWVVDFKNRNTDPYVKEKVHSFQKFNEQRREFESWIELIFDDASTKEVPLTTYIKNRVLVYCPIIKRHQDDKTYSIGEIEKKKEVNDKLVGTGVMIDQDVNMVEESFELKTPDGVVRILPAYVIA